MYVAGGNWCWKSLLSQGALAFPKWAAGEPNDAGSYSVHENCAVLSVKEMGLIGLYCSNTYSFFNIKSVVVCELTLRTAKRQIQVHPTTSNFLAVDPIRVHCPLLIPLIVSISVALISCAFAITACICIFTSRKSKLKSIFDAVSNSTQLLANESNSTYESPFSTNAHELVDYASLPAAN